ncbi:MAG: FtsQ-type POTRA domain-containing protein [Gammaproteobacteria bacterium]|nr:MAG: FtsQ-type POTRA domain-containing protein [Gammaproteobacteria bacterium]
MRENSGDFTVKQDSDGKSVMMMGGIVILVSAFLVVVSNFLYQAFGENAFRIKNIFIRGDYSAEHVPVLKREISHFRDKGFFSLDVRRIQDNIGSIPWVKTVEVGKKWPDSLNIRVEEVKVIAGWESGGMVSETGRWIPPENSVANKVPSVKFSGDRSRLVSHVAVFNQIEKLLSRNGKSITSESITSYDELKIGTVDGETYITNLGDFLGKLKRFFRVYQVIRNDPKHRNERIEYVDLRYPNGFAVKWIKL